MKNDRITPASLRKKAGLTQRDVAAHFNVKVQTVSDWERHVAYPRLTFANVIRFLALYRCSLEELAEAFDREE